MSELTWDEEPELVATTANMFTDDGHVRTLRAIETEVILVAMAKYHGCVSEAARNLGVGRSTLYRKLETLGFLPAVSPGSNGQCLGRFR